MKKKLWVGLAVGVMMLGMAGVATATTLTFDTGSDGLVLGGKEMVWNGTGGGHLFMDYYDGNDTITFNTPSYVNDFQMNAKPWQGYNTASSPHTVGVAALDAIGNTLWSSVVNLDGALTWDNWVTVSVEIANVKTLYFTQGNHSMWPSIDNLRINESAPVPEPATMLLMGTGLAGLIGARRKKKK